MANLIAIMGESGSGKTTSLRNLDPSTTYIFDADKKGLSWRGWKAQYNEGNHNYVAMDDNALILDRLRYINANPTLAHIKTVVIDTMNGIMVADEYARKDTKGYDKWADLAWAVWGIVDYALTMRDDLTVVFLAHSQTERDESGALFTRIKTSGKKLDKLVLESKFTTVLNAKVINGEYVFVTRDPNSTAKAPMGLFETDTVPNDIKSVIDAIDEYNGVSK
ncbi:AAA family ATPase [Collinsella intestinalis]|uniref:AAA family ATPase n=1 Tax=Collinsella intestinalis TaxID=147207 RepID=UPI0022E0FDCB|nr:AAA family ATPase [Collinsella intestinalis]